MQSRHLRWITRTKAEQGGATNEQLREQHKVMSMDSTIRVRRLRLLQAIVQNKQQNKSTIAVLFGTAQAKKPEDDNRRSDAASNASSSTMDQRSKPAGECIPRQGCASTRTYECSVCAKSFTTWQKLNAHKFCAHKTLNYFKQIITEPECVLCKKQFNTIESARRHVLRTCINSQPPALVQA